MLADSVVPTFLSLVDTLSSCVQYLKQEGIEETDVRLQVYPNGQWQLHMGDASYDTDHTGFWGASSLSLYATRNSLKELARDLTEQAQEMEST